MDRPKHRSLSVAAAKARLRRAARQASPRERIRRDPYGAVLTALAAGYLSGRGRPGGLQRELDRLLSSIRVPDDD